MPQEIARRLIDGRWTTDAADDSSGGGGGGGSDLQTVVVPVSAAEILAIGDGTPTILVPAPGASAFLLPDRVVFSYHAGTVPYDFDPSLIVTWSEFQGINVGGMVETLNFLNDAVYVAGCGDFGFNVADPPESQPMGQALVLTATNIFPFAPPLGDGTVDMTVHYREESV